MLSMFFFFKQKTAYEMRISDWSSDVCSSDLVDHPIVRTHPETGRQCLYLGRRANATVVGVPEPESEAMLDALWAHARSEESRVGKECVSTCRSRWSPYH